MKMTNFVSNSDSPMPKVEIMNKLVINEIPDDISDEEKTSCIIAKDLQIPMLSNPEFQVKTKMKMEINKEEINLQIKNETLGHTCPAGFFTPRCSELGGKIFLPSRPTALPRSPRFCPPH